MGRVRTTTTSAMFCYVISVSHHILLLKSHFLCYNDRKQFIHPCLLYQYFRTEIIYIFINLKKKRKN